MILFIFFLNFIFSISNIYIANFIYWSDVTKRIVFNNLDIKNKNAFFLYTLFIIWCIFSTLYYNFFNTNLDFRVFIQFFFSLQYIILLIPIPYKKKKFESIFRYLSLLFALYILLIYLYNYSIIADYMWGKLLIPGWPNGTILPLIFGLWLYSKEKKSIFCRMIIILSIFLTNSRLALGYSIIIFVFYLSNKNKKRLFLSMTIFSIILLTTNMNIVFENFKKINSKQFFYYSDRADIANTVFSYFKKRPLIGYGGNTIDQIYDLEIIDYKPLKNWGHTHNWILEILLRYGLLGLILFFIYISSIFFNIKKKENKMIFILLIVAALFQTFMRDFIFLYYLSYIANIEE